MAIDAKKVIKKLKGETKRDRATLYLDKELLKEFQVACKKHKISSNKAIEELMIEFLDSLKSK